MDIKYEKMVVQNIKTLRNIKGITQEQLAIKLQVNGCDITRSTIAKMEVGQRHIYIDELKSIKEILNIPFDELFVWKIA